MHRKLAALVLAAAALAGPASPGRAGSARMLSALAASQSGDLAFDGRAEAPPLLIIGPTDEPVPQPAKRAPAASEELRPAARQPMHLTASSIVPIEAPKPSGKETAKGAMYTLGGYTSVVAGGLAIGGYATLPFLALGLALMGLGALL